LKKASSQEMTPSNIAGAITAVLSPDDFDHPYYRAIALVSIAYISDTDQGLFRKLKPIEKADYSESEIIEIAVTDMEQILLNGKARNKNELKNTLKEFIQTNKSKHLILFQSEESTPYDFYVEVQ